MINEVLEVMIGLARQGMTMVVVTHEMNFARRVADRVVFMADGAIVEEGAPDAFFDHPQTQRARGFLRQHQKSLTVINPPGAARRQVLLLRFCCTPTTPRQINLTHCRIMKAALCKIPSNANVPSFWSPRAGKKATS